VRLLLRFIGVIAVGGLLLAAGLMAVAPAARDVVTAASSGSEELDLDGQAERSLVFAGDGTVLATLHAEENRSPVGLDEVPAEVVDTILAIEDREFYEHGGVNLRATGRALLENVSSGDIEQGGSTITMQLAKNVLLSPEQDIDRKAKEIVLAWRIEGQMEKDEILERYLNTVYFGGGAYGVQAAAEIYWQKPVGELGWAEAALLAALVRNPVGYDPVNFPEIATERRQIVLDELASQELITPEQAAEFGQIPLPTSRKPVLPPPEDYFVEDVKSQLLRDPRLGETYQDRENAVFRGGLKIYTTVNPTAQQMAEQAVADVLPDNAAPFTAALVAVEPSTGAVRAMVGGPGFAVYQYNLTTQEPGRQTGSAFKGVVLGALLENGYVPSDNVEGGGAFPCPGCEEDPYNVDGRGGTIASVTAASSNGAFVRLGQIVGLDNVVTVAKRLGITAAFDPGAPSMPLGVFDIRPIEMASAFSSYANRGIRNPPYLVQKVEDRDGNVIFEYSPHGERAVSEQSACLATQVLQGVISGGTGTRARIDGQVAAGKTGTTQDNADALFIGYTPYLSTAVWMGDPAQRTEMGNVGGVRVQGGTYPAQIFGAFMNAYHAQLPELEFPECDKTRGGRSIRMDGAARTEDGGGSSRRGSGGGEAEEEAEDQPEEETAPPDTAPPDTAPPDTDPPDTSPPTTGNGGASP
jgi:penicillin-binding protein 1A